MVNDIIKRQNNERNLLNLAAQRNLYSKAENWVKFEIIVGGLIIGALYFTLPVFSQNITSMFNVDYSNIKPFIGFIAPLFGFIFTIIDIWFINPEINNVKEKAAKIQENFDCNVLSLPWNNIKIDHPDEEEVNLNANEYKKKESDLQSLKMWYNESINKLPLDIGRIICQRTNCWWDTNLRENYIKVLTLVGLGLLVLVILITIFEATHAKEIVVGINTLVFGFFSFLYYYIFLIRQIKGNKKSKIRMNRVKQKIDDVLQNILNSDHEQNLDVLSRQIQDELFDHRKTTPIIFDLYYFFKRDEQESSSAFSVEKFVAEYNRKNS